MLRIKRNIDLKELEKLELCQKQNQYIYYAHNRTIISVDIKTNEILVSSFKLAIEKLFDLIQAGMVEKV